MSGEEATTASLEGEDLEQSDVLIFEFYEHNMKLFDGTRPDGRV